MLMVPPRLPRDDAPPELFTPPQLMLRSDAGSLRALQRAERALRGKGAMLIQEVCLAAPARQRVLHTPLLTRRATRQAAYYQRLPA